MAMPFTVVVYGGIGYSVTGDVAAGLIHQIENLQSPAAADLHRFPTTDGREIAVRLSLTMPIAFETEAQRQPAD